MTLQYKINWKYIYFILFILIFSKPSLGVISLPGDIAPKGNPDGVVDQQDVDLLQFFLNGNVSLSDEEKRVANVIPSADPEEGPNSGDLIYLYRISKGDVPDFDDKPPQPISRKYTTVDYDPVTQSLIILGSNGSVEPNADVLVSLGESNSTPIATTQATPMGDFNLTLNNILEGESFKINVRDSSGNESSPVSWNVLNSPEYDQIYKVNYFEIQNETGLPNADPSKPSTLAWASIAYPANNDGSVAVPSGQYMPIAVFIHGNHQNCDSDGAGPSLDSIPLEECTLSQRVPHHRGYRYLMEELAGLGVFSISIYNIEAMSNGETLLRYIDLVNKWNQQEEPSYPEIGNRFVDRLDLQNIMFIGHSRGGTQAFSAIEMAADWPNQYEIKAMVGIAPDNNQYSSQSSPHLSIDLPYLLMFGTRDGDISDWQTLETAQRIGENILGSQTTFNLTAIIRGANHNYFNTIWTDSVGLGEDNPWAGAEDDGEKCFIAAEAPMSALDQRNSAATLIKSFAQVQLLQNTDHESVLLGAYKFSLMPNNKIQRIIRGGNRILIDGFNDDGQLNVNDIGGLNNFSVPIISECTFTASCQGIQPTIPGVRHLSERWLAVAGSTEGTLRFNFAGFQDLTNKRLQLRLGKYAYNSPPIIGSDLPLTINLIDENGNSAIWDLRISDYARIPHPYMRQPTTSGYSGCGLQTSNPTYLTSVDIPATHFANSSPGLDLTAIIAIVLRGKSYITFAADQIELVE